jgi:hypothetical protein
VIPVIVSDRSEKSAAAASTQGIDIVGTLRFSLS